MEEQARKFVVGLGNPGRQYAATRHNVGFEVVALLADRWQLGDGRSAFEGRIADGTIRKGGEDCRLVLLQPHTYMNRSGRSVRRMMDFYKADVDQLLVVYDEMALDLGRIRARPGGSAAGHKGLGDILSAMGTQQVPRLRVGIGSPPGRMDAAEYVLRPFNSDERDEIEVACQRAADAVEDWLFHGLDWVMERYNRKPDA